MGGGGREIWRDILCVGIRPKLSTCCISCSHSASRVFVSFGSLLGSNCSKKVEERGARRMEEERKQGGKEDQTKL